MPYLGPGPTSESAIAQRDLQGGELILDADNDTTITADTDDQIDIKIAGSDEIKITAAMIAPASADGSALGGTSNEWSDLYLADGAVIGLGVDQDVTLTHVADTGVLLNSTMAIQVNDASQYINAPSNAILDINATDEIELNATLADINANVDISGTLTLGGAVAGADQTLARVNLKDYGEVTSALGSAGGSRTIDLEDGNNFTATVTTSTVTWTFSNPTASDELCGFTLFLTNGGSQTVNWPAAVDWAGGSAPDLTSSGLDILVFITTDGGTIWHGMVASTDSKSPS